jgi:hypothetical protein
MPQFLSEFACFKVLPALPFGKIYKNVYISAISLNLKEKKCACQAKTEE